MINERSRNGIEELLSSFDDEGLFSLASTVTQGLLRNKIKSRQEAIKTIIDYSPDVDSLLKRKIIKREILFEYLHRNNIKVAVPSTKNDLILAVKSFWQSDDKESQDNITNDKVTKPNLVNEMAKQFSEWFYSMMNANDQIGVEHFYPDCKLILNMLNGSKMEESDVIENNAEEVTRKLFMVKSQYNLTFNPNLTEDGVQGRLDPHGLVMVLCCGTLHVNNFIIGVFEQVFSLARDPSSENNWKIKTIQLNLKSQGNINKTPSLCESGLTSQFLPLPSC